MLGGTHNNFVVKKLETPSNRTTYDLVPSPSSFCTLSRDFTTRMYKNVKIVLNLDFSDVNITETVG